MLLSFILPFVLSFTLHDGYLLWFCVVVPSGHHSHCHHRCALFPIAALAAAVVILLVVAVIISQAAANCRSQIATGQLVEGPSCEVPTGPGSPKPQTCVDQTAHGSVLSATMR